MARPELRVIRGLVDQEAETPNPELEALGYSFLNLNHKILDNLIRRNSPVNMRQVKAEEDARRLLNIITGYMGGEQISVVPESTGVRLDKNDKPTLTLLAQKDADLGFTFIANADRISARVGYAIRVGFTFENLIRMKEFETTNTSMKSTLTKKHPEFWELDSNAQSVLRDFDSLPMRSVKEEQVGKPDLKLI